MKTDSTEKIIEDFSTDAPTAGRRQAQAVAAVLLSRTLGEAAEKIEVHPTTLSKWMREPEFKEQLRQAETDLIDTAVTRLAAETGKCLDTLTEIRDDRAAPAGARVRASTVLLELTIRLREQLTFERRLEALEDKQ